MMSDGYDMFIQQALLDPIRSALIIDDDYPTYDDVLNGFTSPEKTEKRWTRMPQRVIDLIGQFRNRKIPLLVDIHDGKNFPEGGPAEMAGHLHQSDLLVLDYELDRNLDGDGTIAINILRRIAENEHFNLVIVYTSMELEIVFQQMRIGLLCRCQGLGTRVKDVTTVALERLEGAEEIWNGAMDEILASVGTEAYLAYRNSPSRFWTRLEKAEQPLTEFHRLCTKAGLEGECQNAVLTYALWRREEELAGDMSPVDLGSLSWPDADPYWIQSDSVFVAFARKGEHDQLMDRLARTLSAWSPPPSRLFLSRLRAEIDEQGFSAQESVLGRRRALAFWYNRLLGANRELRRQHVADSMRVHADLLLEQVLPKVSRFAHEMIEFDKTEGRDDKVICSDRFGVDLNNADESHKALIEHNALACSRPIGGRHLTTGHVFKKGDEHWICMSPACDMVPGQGSSIKRKHFGDWIPFIAVLLHPRNEAQSKTEKRRLEREISDERCIFLPSGDNEYLGFLFTLENNSQPLWHVAYAKSNGLFHAAGGHDHIVTIRWTERHETELLPKEFDAQVVGQLRYEYALNLSNRLAASFSRVGLDFVGKIS